MPDQNRITGYLTSKLSQQLANVQNALQQEKLNQNLLNSQKIAQPLAHANPDRVHDKVQSVEKNAAIMDHLHISPEAQLLFRAHEAGLTQAPEKAHDRRTPDSEQTTEKTEPTSLT